MFWPEPLGADAVVLWDCNNLAFRALHGYRNLTRSDGSPSGHIYGMLSMVKSFHEQHFSQFEKVCNLWCFDSYPEAKHKLFQETWGFAYKGDRTRAFDPVPDLQRLVTFLCGTVAITDGIECDCTIANLARVLKDRTRVFMVTNDRDLWTMVNEVTVVAGKETITEERVWREFGVAPSHVSLWKALFGDSSDCIPPLIKFLPKKQIIPYIQESDGTPEDFLVKIRANPKWGPKFHELEKLLLAQWDIVKLFTPDWPTMKTYSGDRFSLESFLQGFQIKKVVLSFYMEGGTL